MFLTPKNLSNIVSGSYRPSSSLKSNLADRISILIGSNHSIWNIFLSKPPRDFILVSRPMFLTLRNLPNIVPGSYHHSNSMKSNVAAVHNEVNHKIIITQQALKIETSF
jgi:hypothetical protein